MNIRTEIALHPAVVKAVEALLKKLADAGVGLAETAAVEFIPMGDFLKPIIVAAAGFAEGKTLDWLDHALDQLNQAQPTTFPGSGVAGLDSIEEIDTPKPPLHLTPVPFPISPPKQGA